MILNKLIKLMKLENLVINKLKELLNKFKKEKIKLKNLISINFNFLENSEILNFLIPEY